MKIKRVIEDILGERTPFLRASTQENHKIYLGELTREIGEFTIKEFTRREYLRWLGDFKKRKKRTTYFDYTKFINMIFRHAFEHGLSEHLCIFPFIDPKKGKVGRVYSEEELGRMWDAIETVEMELKFCLAYEMYMRKNEAAKLEWNRVDLKQRAVILRPEDVKTGSSTGEGRTVPMSDLAFEVFSAMKKKAKSRWVFPNKAGDGPSTGHKRAWNKIKRDADIVGRARWHDMRGTALTHASEKEGNLKKIGKVAGVSMRTMERVYLQERIDSLRETTQILKISHTT